MYILTPYTSVPHSVRVEATTPSSATTQLPTPMHLPTPPPPPATLPTTHRPTHPHTPLSCPRTTFYLRKLLATNKNKGLTLCHTGMCRVSEKLMYSAVWNRTYVLTPYTPVSPTEATRHEQKQRPHFVCACLKVMYIHTCTHTHTHTHTLHMQLSALPTPLTSSKSPTAVCRVSCCF